MQKRNLLLFLMLILFLAACGTDEPAGNTNGQNGDQTVTEPPLDLTVADDAAGLTGRVISSVNENPLGNMEVWLAAVVWNEERTEGAYFIDGSASPTTRTRADGRFFFDALEPNEYVIVVGDLYGQNVVMSNTDGSARIYPAELGEVVDAGTLRVDLEPVPTVPPGAAYPDNSQPAATDVPEAYP